MLEQIPELLMDVIMTEWESPEQMWEEIAAELGTSVERVRSLFEQFAFVSPFDRTGKWQGTPRSRSCKLCANPPLMHGEDLCRRHSRHQAEHGIFGDWQYHRLCNAGLDKHSKPKIDKHRVPRCLFCQKSLIVIPADAIAKFRKRKSIKRQLTQLVRENPEDRQPGKMFRLLQAKKRADASIRNPRK